MRRLGAIPITSRLQNTDFLSGKRRANPVATQIAICFTIKKPAVADRRLYRCNSLPNKGFWLYTHIGAIIAVAHFRDVRAGFPFHNQLTHTPLCSF